MIKKSTEEIANEMDSAATFEELQNIVEQYAIGRERFGDRLLELCAIYRTTPAMLQRRVAMSKSLFYAVINGTRKPSKETVIKIALSLGVSIEEADELLKISGHKELYVKNRDDAIILFGIRNKKSIYEINELLRSYHSEMKLLDEE